MPSTEERVDRLYLLLSDVLGKIKDLRGDMALLRQEGLGTETVAVAEGAAIVFLDAKATVTTSASSISFTTYNAAGVVPGGAQGVIIETWGYATTGTGGNPFAHVRKDSTSISLIALFARAEQGTDLPVCVTQVFCPITASRTFDYELTISINVFEMRVVGYWT